MSLKIQDKVAGITGVGAELTKKFGVLGIETAGDLILNFPRRYDDYSVVSTIRELSPGPVTIEAVIKQVKGRYVRRGMHITEAVASDATDSVRLVWFNQPYRESGLKTGQPYFISGQYELSRQRFAIMNPSVELVSDFPSPTGRPAVSTEPSPGVSGRERARSDRPNGSGSYRDRGSEDVSLEMERQGRANAAAGLPGGLNTARILPVYRETKGLTSKQIRRVLREVVPLIRELPETLPAWLVKEQKLMPYNKAVLAMHFPESSTQLEEAKRRIGFEEVFHLTLASLFNKYELMEDTAVSIPFNEKLAREFVGALPFELTGAQRKVVWRIYLDIQKKQPMNRLVEGDVGSGKTVVAAMAAVMAIAEGYQAVLMAPTELLARQHAETVYSLLNPLGLHDSVALLVGGMNNKAKETAREAIREGRAKFIIGTHTLIQESVDMHKLGLVIVDEQHRFGVEQRQKLLSKAGHMPHLLSLTATPIPRSLALTLYGELDISVLDVKPPGRQPIITKIASPNSRAQLNAEIEKELKAGRQMFVVTPLISDQSPAASQDRRQKTNDRRQTTDNRRQMAISSAEKIYEQFSKKDFKNWRVGLLHGKMKPAEKNDVMEKFLRHELDILVSTTVIEVGVDVPNASVMLIEAAERFGPAQSPQLRGRVGRGGHKGYCYLMMSDSSAPPKRLQALERMSDGFKLAEMDLELRGPGAIYGTLQHGALDLRVAKLTDTHLIAAARNAALQFIEKGENLLQYPQLKERVAALRAVTNLN